MGRGAKIFALTHLYPIYILLHMKYGNWGIACTFLFNVMPIFFVSLLLNIWVKTSNIKLTYPEKINLYLFVYFFVIVHAYYGICALVMNTSSGKTWIEEHNSYFIYFVTFMFSFYLLCYANKRWS